MTETLRRKIIKWAEEREILDRVPPFNEAMKTYEEVGELIQAIHDDDIEAIKDAVGDVAITLVLLLEVKCKYKDYRLYDEPDTSLGALYISFFLLDELELLLKLYVTEGFISTRRTEAMFLHLTSICDLYKFNFTDCVEGTYNEIKDRTREIINRHFVKDVQTKKCYRSKWLDSRNNSFYRTECDERYRDELSDYAFCPYCGKRIIQKPESEDKRKLL